MKLVERIFKILLSGMFIFYCFSSEAQNFNASLILGMNAAQIDGDQLYGYNKPGLQAGFAISREYRVGIDFTLEFLYCQRGSQDGFSFGGRDDEKLRTSLDYVSFPMLMEFHLIKDVDDRYRFKIYPGIAYSYLIDGTSPGGGIVDNENFRTHDISYVAGLSYLLVKGCWIGFRYTRGLIGVIDIPTRNEEALSSYFLNFRMEVDL